MAGILTINGKDFGGDGWSISGRAKTGVDATKVNAAITAMKKFQTATPAYTGASVADKLAITTNVASGNAGVEASVKYALKFQTSYNTVLTKYLSCADFTKANADDKIDLTSTDGAALKTALEDIFADPSGGALTLIEMVKA